MNTNLFSQDIPPQNIHPTAIKRGGNFKVNSPNVDYANDVIKSTYEHKGAKVNTKPDGQIIVEPTNQTWKFETDSKPKKTG